MTIDELTSYCLTKKGAVQDPSKIPDVIEFKIGSKVFMRLLLHANKSNLSVRLDPFAAENMKIEYPSISSDLHKDRGNWYTVAVDGAVPDSELCWMIDHSYGIAVKKLSKAEQSMLL